MLHEIPHYIMCSADIQHRTPVRCCVSGEEGKERLLGALKEPLPLPHIMLLLQTPPSCMVAAASGRPVSDCAQHIAASSLQWPVCDCMCSRTG